MSTASFSNGCRRVRARLERLLDGTLDPLAAALDQGHLEACDSCRAERDDWRALLGRVRGAERAPRGEEARVMADVMRRLPATRPRLRVRPARWRRGLAAAAAVLFLAWLGTSEGLLSRVRIEVGEGVAAGLSAPIERLPSWSQLADGWARLSRRFF